MENLDLLCLQLDERADLAPLVGIIAAARCRHHGWGWCGATRGKLTCRGRPTARDCTLKKKRSPDFYTPPPAGPVLEGWSTCSSSEGWRGGVGFDSEQKHQALSELGLTGTLGGGVLRSRPRGSRRDQSLVFLPAAFLSLAPPLLPTLCWCQKILSRPFFHP